MGFGHAVVLGGSVTGMAAAQALAGAFDKVTLVERDAYPATVGEFRRGVPQARHLHVLLESGGQAFEQLFPGLEEDLRQAGAHWIGVPQDLCWLDAHGWSTRFPSRRHLISISRERLDHLVRTRVAGTPNVSVVDGCTVTGLLPDATGVRGVRLLDHHGTLTEWAADLVVDATGRNTRTPQWLTELGYRPPVEVRIDPALSYASRRYRIPAGFDGGWKAAFLLPRPPTHQRFGALFPLEGDQWAVTLGGFGGRDRSPTDEAGYLRFARSLRSPLIYEAIRSAEPLTDITAYGRTESRRRYYDKLRRWPERLVVLGDAACAFNPIYGQGMSVGAQTALALHHALQDGEPLQAGFARRFQRTVAHCSHPAWLMATGEDLRYPTTTGTTAGPATRLAHRWFDRVIAAANTDPLVNAALVDVVGLAAPPASLLRPSIVRRVLRPQQSAQATPSEPFPATVSAQH